MSNLKKLLPALVLISIYSGTASADWQHVQLNETIAGQKIEYVAVSADSGNELQWHCTPTGLVVVYAFDEFGGEVIEEFGYSEVGGSMSINNIKLEQRSFAINPSRQGVYFAHRSASLITGYLYDGSGDVVQIQLTDPYNGFVGAGDKFDITGAQDAVEKLSCL